MWIFSIFCLIDSLNILLNLEHYKLFKNLSDDEPLSNAWYLKVAFKAKGSKSKSNIN
jgi:hypothetical protein